MLCTVGLVLDVGQVLQSKFFCNVNVGKLKGRPDEIAKILKYCRSADVLHSSLDLEESLLEWLYERQLNISYSG